LLKQKKWQLIMSKSHAVRHFDLCDVLPSRELYLEVSAFKVNFIEISIAPAFMPGIELEV